MKRKILSMIMAISMLLNTGVMPVFAADEPMQDSGATLGTSGICEHHREHTGECGYIEDVEGAVCTNHCDECAAEQDDPTCTCEAAEGEPHAEECLLYEAPTCTCEAAEGETHAEGCELYAEPAEPECVCETGCAADAVNPGCPVCAAEEADLSLCTGAEAAAVKTITAWSWIDESEVLDPETNTLPLTGASERNKARLADIIGLLPLSITATIDGGEETVMLGAWSCPDFPAEGAGSGSYVFTADLPEGYELAEVAPALTVTAELGGGSALQARAAEPHASHDNWTAWSETDSLPDAAGSYYLSTDVTLSSLWTVPADETTLCLNGHTITAASNNYGVFVDSDVTFTLTDCTTQETQGYIDSSDHLWEPGAVTDGTTQTACNLTGGVITGASHTSFGCIYVAGTFKMYGGNIAGNAKKGGVTVASNASFNLYGGTVCGNRTENNGGGVYVAQQGTFTMEGGSVCHNYAAGSFSGGGGVCVGSSAEFEMSGGKISSNQTGNGGMGGGIYVDDGSAVVYNEAVVEQNQAPEGGGIYIHEAGKVELEDGAKVTDNTATSGGGGGVFVFIDGTLNGSGKISISRNTSQGQDGGGGIFSAGEVTLTDGEITISNNEASNGGGISAQEGRLTISNSHISSNTASYSGGGIYVSSYADLSITDSSLTGNNAPRGGGIYYAGSTDNAPVGKVVNTEISGNQATYDGGGIYVSPAPAHLSISGGSITRNSALRDGGGIYLYWSGKVSLSGNLKISENTANSAANNLHVEDTNGKVTIGTEGTGGTEYLTDGASIGITYQPEGPTDDEPIALTGANGADYSAYFFSDDPAYGIYNGESNEVMMGVNKAITYDANGGTGIQTAGVNPINVSYTLPECTFTPPSGCGFKGWALTANAPNGEVTVKAGETYTIPGDVTFYAVWYDRQVKINVTADTGLIYDGEPKAGYTATLTSPGGYTGTYTATYSGTTAGGSAYNDTEPPKDAGTYTVTFSLPADCGYEWSADAVTSVNFTIDKRQLAWDASGLSASKPEGSTEEAAVYGELAVSGILNNEIAFTSPTDLKTSGFATTTAVGSYNDVQVVSQSGSWGFAPAAPDNYIWPSGNPTITATVNEVSESGSYAPDPTRPEVYMTKVEHGISVISEELKTAGFNTVPRIQEKLLTDGEAALTGVQTTGTTSAAYYEIGLWYSTDGGNTWEQITADNWPDDVDSIPVRVPFPTGITPANVNNYVFKLIHMFSTGANDQAAGTTEILDPTVVSGTPYFTANVTGLSPFALVWEQKASTSNSGGSYDDNDDSGSSYRDYDDSGSSYRDYEEDFWKKVEKKIEEAKSGNKVIARAGGYDRMPAYVMKALRERGDIMLEIHWNGGDTILIPAGKALNEPNRIYYPLSYLEDYDFGDVQAALEHVNPETGGGPLEVNAPAISNTITTPDGKPEVTDSRRGLAATIEDAEKGIEKAIPGVYEPEIAESVADTVTEPQSKSRSWYGAWILLAALAVGGGYIYFRKRKEANE